MFIFYVSNFKIKHKTQKDLKERAGTQIYQFKEIMQFI